MYVAVKGGEKAIEASHRLLDEARRGDPSVPEVSTRQIAEQLGLAVDRVMSEGSLYDRELAALAIKQAQGDLIEAVFLLRAYRTTLPRLGNSEPVDTARMAIRRRISATFKDIPGGQILGPTYDYTHRLLDFRLAGEGGDDGDGFASGEQADPPTEEPVPRVVDLLGREGLMEEDCGPAAGEEPPTDITREPLRFPAGRDARLQTLARGDEGFLLALGYSTQRGFSNNHPFAGEIRYGLGRGRNRAGRTRFRHRDRRDRGDRGGDGQPVQGQRRGAAAIYAGIRARLRPPGAQGHVHGARGPRASRGRA